MTTKPHAWKPGPVVRGRARCADCGLTPRAVAHRIADESTALRDDSPPTVAAYFAAQLGTPLYDPETRPGEPPHVSSPYHPTFHVETGCGIECKGAIDAAAALLEHVRAAYGRPGLPGAHPHADHYYHVVRMTADVVLCYVYG